MEWVRASLLVVALAQWTYGRESIQSISSPHLGRRNIVSRTPSGELQPDKDDKEEIFPGRVLYHVQEDLRTPRSASLPYGDSPSGNLEGDAYLVNDSEKPFQGAFEEENQSLAYEDRSLPSSLAEEWNNGGYGDNLPLTLNEENTSNDLRDMTPLNAEERLVLQKRLQMKGLGLLGSPRGKPSSLVGFSKSPSKGLVLSIDLGIKALRDAILHAKVQQKNRQHKMQAQKNMRLLHNIGKRRTQSTSLDRP